MDDRIPYPYFADKLMHWLRRKTIPGTIFLMINDPDVEQDKFTEKDYVALFGEEAGPDEYRKAVLRDSKKPAAPSVGCLKRYNLVPLSSLPYSQDGTSYYSDDLVSENNGFVANKVELHDPRNRFFDLVINLDEAYFYYTSYGMPYVRSAIQKMLEAMHFLKPITKNTNWVLSLNAKGQELFSLLKDLRLDMSKTRQVSPYIIFSNRALYEMCLSQPFTMDELKCVYGVGEKRAVRYGQPFLDAIIEFTGKEHFPAEREDTDPHENVVSPTPAEAMG
ncbi:MAG: HRDC domain-containing protein [Lachnospiraceae bacterium]|nr:HRDC domain-containing protein [Lachnospiraceae bacterium]